MKSPFEIGHLRPDGKYNVWKQTRLRGANPHFPPVWVIAQVAASWPQARDWIKEQEKRT